MGEPQMFGGVPMVSRETGQPMFTTHPEATAALQQAQQHQAELQAMHDAFNAQFEGSGGPAARAYTQVQQSPATNKQYTQFRDTVFHNAEPMVKPLSQMLNSTGSTTNGV